MIYTDKLQSARIITRFLTAGDAPGWATFFKDSEATAFSLNPKGLSPLQQAQEMIDLCIKRYADGRYGLQALISKHTGEMLGMCGLLHQEVNGIAEIEIGYHLFRSQWGRGYAQEAAQLFRDYGFEGQIAPSITSIIRPLNWRSKQVAARNGMQLSQAGIIWRNVDCDIFRITREEWCRLKNKTPLNPDTHSA